MSEFGATTNVPLVATLTKSADDLGLGWSYYSWKYYADPTGSTSEALLTASGAYAPTVVALSRTYPQAVAGTPTSVTFNPDSGAFQMTYVPRQTTAPTSIFVGSAVHYPH